ncbi:hypothetical protein K2X89_01815, partial [Myxococcota bacterium]|nr:hypothetical protein [Myxococcota bacterium]
IRGRRVVVSEKDRKHAASGARRPIGYRAPMLRTRPALVLLALAALLPILLATGCASRPSRHSILSRTGMQVDLVRYTRGFKTEPQGFAHPAIISKERLTNILGSIEIETREKKSAATIRQPGIHAEMIAPIAEALSDALRQAGVDEEVGIQAVRKERSLGIFHTKYLTTLLAWVKGDSLYVQLHRTDWPIPQAKEDKPLPEPMRNTRPMDFRVVSGEHLFFAGPQTLEIDFGNDVFRTAYHLPGSTGGTKLRREVLLESPIPASERKDDEDSGVRLDQLGPEQLRALADLEEDRRSGRITEQAYQKARRELLRPR